MAEIVALVSGNTIERLLDRIDADISNFLIFAGVLDNNAKLLSFRRGKANFSLPIERHDTLDVQLSLMFSLIRQLEDISGPHKFTVTRFARHDIFLFGTPDLHIFVITSPTSEGQVAKTLAELVATMNEVGFTMETPNFVVRNDQTMAAAMTSVRNDDVAAIRQLPPAARSPGAKPRPEVITMLQGYLMALEANVTIQDDISGTYKIKTDGDRFAWSNVERWSSTFKDKIAIHHIGLDNDGKVFIKISAK